MPFDPNKMGTGHTPVHPTPVTRTLTSSTRKLAPQSPRPKLNLSHQAMTLQRAPTMTLPQAIPLPSAPATPLPSAPQGGGDIEPDGNARLWHQMKTEESPEPELVRQGLMSLFDRETFGEVQTGTIHADQIATYVQGKLGELGDVSMQNLSKTRDRQERSFSKAMYLAHFERERPPGLSSRSLVKKQKFPELTPAMDNLVTMLVDGGVIDGVELRSLIDTGRCSLPAKRPGEDESSGSKRDSFLTGEQERVKSWKPNSTPTSPRRGLTISRIGHERAKSETPGTPLQKRPDALPPGYKATKPIVRGSPTSPYQSALKEHTKANSATPSLGTPSEKTTGALPPEYRATKPVVSSPRGSSQLLAPTKAPSKSRAEQLVNSFIAFVTEYEAITPLADGRAYYLFLNSTPQRWINSKSWRACGRIGEFSTKVDDFAAVLKRLNRTLSQKETSGLCRPAHQTGGGIRKSLKRFKKGASRSTRESAAKDSARSPATRCRRPIVAGTGQRQVESARMPAKKSAALS